MNLLFLDSTVFTSFCLQASELNDTLNFVTFVSDFLIEKIGGRFIIGLTWYYCSKVQNSSARFLKITTDVQINVNN
jgi:hypothetical protein